MSRPCRLARCTSFLTNTAGQYEARAAILQQAMASLASEITSRAHITFFMKPRFEVLASWLRLEPRADNTSLHSWFRFLSHHFEPSYEILSRPAARSMPTSFDYIRLLMPMPLEIHRFITIDEISISRAIKFLDKINYTTHEISECL